MTWDIPLSSNGGAVSSVFGRTGAITAQNGDYFGVVAAALTGATSGTTRLAGALNVSGPPIAGTFQVGDMVMDPSATLWVCTVAGTPGTWSPTVSQVFANRSSSATMALNEFTLFSGSTAAQTLTLPSNSVHGTLNIIANYSTVSVTISGGAGSLSNYGTTGSIILLPNQAVSIASDGSGGWYVISPLPPLTYRKTGSTTVSNTVTETDLLGGAITIPANAMGTNRVLQFQAGGDWVQNSGGNLAAPRFKLKLGATTLIDTGAPGSPATISSATRYAWNVSATISELAATNSQSVNFQLNLTTSTGYVPTGAFALTSGEGAGTILTGAGAGPGVISANAWTSSAVDMTAAQALTLTVILPTASANVNMVCYNALAQII
jgi:hypothetical protein